MSKRIEIKQGEQFGRLIIVKEIELHKQPSGQVKRKFQCKCQCGNFIQVRLDHLKNGSIISCGCYHKEKLYKSSITHGLTNHPLYSTWYGMLQRTNNSKHKSYKDYGGRGIKVCDRWLETPKNFFDDMGEKPSPNYTLDRINNDGHYEPSNCRWSTRSEQILNQRPKKRN